MWFIILTSYSFILAIHPRIINFALLPLVFILLCTDINRDVISLHTSWLPCPGQIMFHYLSLSPEDSMYRWIFSYFFSVYYFLFLLVLLLTAVELLSSWMASSVSSMLSSPLAFFLWWFYSSILYCVNRYIFFHIRRSIKLIVQRFTITTQLLGLYNSKSVLSKVLHWEGFLMVHLISELFRTFSNLHCFTLTCLFTHFHKSLWQRGITKTSTS